MFCWMQRADGRGSLDSSLTSQFSGSNRGNSANASPSQSARIRRMSNTNDTNASVSAAVTRRLSLQGNALSAFEAVDDDDATEIDVCF